VLLDLVLACCVQIEREELMSAEPLFSIITATYNRAHLLPRAVNSVLNQTYQNFELIIVDDGSTDNTEDVCRSFSDRRIRYHKQTPNRGVYAARNKALDLATGDYVAILDDDDELVPQALETALAEFRRLSPEDIEILWFNNIDYERKRRSGWGPTRAESYICYEDLLCDRVGGDFWQVLKRDIISDEDRFDDRLLAGEILWWLKLHRKCQAYYVPKLLLVCHREHGAERISNLHTMLNRLPQFILTNKALLEQFGEEQRSLCPRAYGRRLAVLGAYQIMNGEKAEGRKACRESFKYYKWPGFVGIYLLSFILSGREIKRLASAGIKIMDRLNALQHLPTR
jgi:glycosyltransferase involved in cell wall biosynthesis